jgi:site-specific recombinase XerD
MRAPSPAATAPAAPDSAGEDLLARYLVYLSAEKNLSPFTQRNYANDLRHLFAHLASANVAPTSITRLVFRGYIAAMMDAGTAQGSIVRRVSTARSFYRWLRLAGVMHDDPLANVRGPKQARRLPHALTLDDISGIIAAADGEKPSGLRDRALLEAMYASGLRVSEAAGMDAGDVSLDEMTMLVRGKGNKERLVVMGQPARHALERYLKAGRPTLAKRRKATSHNAGTDSARSPERSSGALFLNRAGGRLSQRRIQLIVRKYALKAGIDERVHPHLLRHTFATHLLDGGAELRVVQELMGHSSPNTTQIYLHVTEERQRKALESSLDGVAEVEMARRASRKVAPDA